MDWGILEAFKMLCISVDINSELFSKDKKIDCDLLIIPGVGSFSEASKIINNKFKIICKLIKENKFLLGICLGMQIMAEKGNENGSFLGLGIFKGDVKVTKNYSKNL